MSGPRIIFYDGAGVLGGNMFLLEDQGTRVMIDTGPCPDRMNRLYDWPAGPRRFDPLGELTRLGVLPHPDDAMGLHGINFDGVYRQDYLRQMGRKPTPEPTIDGVYISHAHMDHIGGLHYYRPDIPVYMDRHTKRIAYALGKTGLPYNEFVDFTYSSGEALKLRDDGSTRLTGDAVTVSRDIRRIEPPKRFKIGNIEFEPFYVDHSMPGTCALIIYTSIGPIGYTADIRLRGRRREDTERFIEACAKAKLRYLLCEGSLIWKKHPGVEDDVVQHIYTFAKRTPGLLVVSCPPRDLDRVKSFHMVAQELGRTLVNDVNQNHLLELFGGEFEYPRPDSENMGVYLPRQNRGMLDAGNPNEEQDYSRWLRQYIDHPRRVTAEDIRKNPGRYILNMPGQRRKWLLDLEPPPGSGYVRSHPEPFTEGMMADEKTLREWLKMFNLLVDTGDRAKNDLWDAGMEFAVPQVHVTGHMSLEDTGYLLNAIDPDIFVPIHEQRSEAHLFGQVFDRARTWFPERNGVLELRAA